MKTLIMAGKRNARTYEVKVEKKYVEAKEAKRWKVEIVKEGGARIKAGQAWRNYEGEICIYLDVLPVEGKLLLTEQSQEAYELERDEKSALKGGDR